jgi:hypothetical protein
MRLVAAVLAIGIIFSGLAPGAEAAQPPRVQAYSCSYLVATRASHIWQTWFTGARRDLWDHYDTYTAAPCFTGEASCKAWLYWAQSDWPDRNTFRPCRRGLVY